jgi:pyrimidine deaminase RibD-like protein
MTTFAAQPAPGLNPADSSAPSAHLKYLRQCLSLAERSPPRPSNFRVGAILVLRRDEPGPTDDDTVLSTGYTLELAGNTHAEQCCLANYAATHGVHEDRVADAFPPAADRKSRRLILYVTMEPCGYRLSGNTPCVQRIIQTRQQRPEQGINKVYFGVKEPGTFVGESRGCKMLTDAGVEWAHVPGLETEILAVATAGHEKKDEEKQEREAAPAGGTNVDDISPEERRRQEELPRNPKKRMMDTTLQ